jgi:hypothetical protein
VQPNITADFLNAPSLKLWANEQMHRVSVTQQSPHKVRPHKTGSAGDQTTFHVLAIK